MKLFFRFCSRRAGIKVAALLFGVAFLATASRPAAAAPISQPAYVARVHQLRLAVDALGTARPDRTTREALVAAAQRLYVVRLTGDRTMNTGFPKIATGLGGGPAAFVNSRNQINALDTALRSSPVRGPSAAENSQLQSILAGPDFHPQVSPIDRFKEWLGNQINRFLASLGRQLNGHHATFSLLGVVALALIVVLAILIGRSTLSRVVTETAAPLDIVKGLTASQAFVRADQLAAAGDYLSALRTLFAATLLRLAELDYLELRVGMTNREYLELLRRGAPAADPAAKTLPPQLVKMFERLTYEFERACYGGYPVDATTYAQAQVMAGAVIVSPQDRAA